jgi:hypothetical protein
VRNFLALILTTLTLAACGGGGGNSSTTTTTGGGGGTTTGTIAAAGAPNAEPLTIDAGPAGLTVPDINTAFVSITLCTPGTTTCQTIDHVEIDTGSIGLRLISSAVTVALTAQTDGSGNPLGECLEFADNTAVWGSLAQADMKLPVSGEAAAGVTVQLIGDASVGTTAPAACSGTLENTVNSFGANGILGVGPLTADCNPGGDCMPNTGTAAQYFSCPTTGCVAITASATQQLPNPVSMFATDNNGVIVELPAIGADGAADPSGAVIVFGIGTESNNALGSATQLLADPESLLISSTLNGTTYATTYLDSGSNANFLNDSRLASDACPSPNQTFLCPSSTVSENATLQGTSGTTFAADFTVGNADNLFSANPNFTAYNDIAAKAGDTTTLDLGLPFFYGNNIYTAIENPNTGANPYYAIIAN